MSRKAGVGRGGAQSIGGEEIVSMKISRQKAEEHG